MSKTKSQVYSDQIDELYKEIEHKKHIIRKTEQELRSLARSMADLQRLLNQAIRAERMREEEAKLREENKRKEEARRREEQKRKEEWSRRFRERTSAKSMSTTPTVEESLKYLGLDSRATLADVRSQRKKLAKYHHPDKGGDIEKMKKINVLCDICEAFFRKT